MILIEICCKTHHKDIKKKQKTKMSKFERMSNNNSGNKPPTTRYFAAWEVDRTPSNCVPR